MVASGFRLGIYVGKGAEIVDFAAPHGVLAVARRFAPELEAFLVADALRPVQAQARFGHQVIICYVLTLMSVRWCINQLP